MACLLNPSSIYSKPDSALPPPLSFVTSRRLLDLYFYYPEAFSKLAAHPFFFGESLCILGVKSNPSLLFSHLLSKTSYSDIAVIQFICQVSAIPLIS